MDKKNIIKNQEKNAEIFSKNKDNKEVLDELEEFDLDDIEVIESKVFA